MTSEADNPGDRSLLEVATVLRKSGRWIAGATLSGMALAATISALVTPVYRADVTLVVGGNDPSGAALRGADLERALGTWAFVLNDRSTFDGAARQLAGRFPKEKLRAVKVTARPIDNSMIVLVSVRADAADLAAEFAQRLVDVVASGEVGRSFPAGSLVPPTIPDAPEVPKARRNILIGGVAGFLIGMALAFLVDDLRRNGWSRRRLR
jgi:capsular polysaccharide biosynthesis protein